MKINTPYNVSGLNPAEAAAAAGSDAVIPSDEIVVEEAIVNEEPTDSFALQSSAVVSDDMTFSQAFAAARAELGPGAAFTWHGQVYGTYYQDEWNAMTPAEQHAFTAAAVGAHPVETPLEVTIDDTDYAKADDEEIEDVDVNDDFEVRVIGYDSIDSDGQQVNIAALSVGDEPVFMIDLDNDNVYDYTIGDFDGSDSILDSVDDIRDISDLGITTDQIAGIDDTTSPVDIDNPMMDNDMASMDMV